MRKADKEDLAYWLSAILAVASLTLNTVWHMSKDADQKRTSFIIGLSMLMIPFAIARPIFKRLERHIPKATVRYYVSFSFGAAICVAVSNMFSFSNSLSLNILFSFAIASIGSGLLYFQFLRWSGYHDQSDTAT